MATQHTFSLPHGNATRLSPLLFNQCIDVAQEFAWISHARPISLKHCFGFSRYAIRITSAACGCFGFALYVIRQTLITTAMIQVYTVHGTRPTAFDLKLPVKSFRPSSKYRQTTAGGP